MRDTRAASRCQALANSEEAREIFSQARGMCELGSLHGCATHPKMVVFLSVFPLKPTKKGGSLKKDIHMFQFSGLTRERILLRKGLAVGKDTQTHFSWHEKARSKAVFALSFQPSPVEIGKMSWTGFAALGPSRSRLPDRPKRRNTKA